MTSARSPAIRPGGLDAVIFDLDGVLTDTARLHYRAWKETFDALLRERAGRGDGAYAPFTRDDYLRHVDGKPRYEGAEDFLRSRGIDLPRGEEGDAPGRDTVCAVGNDKDRRYRARLEEGGLDAIEGSVEFARRVRGAGLATAVVTSSRNGEAVLDAAGIRELAEVLVDGRDLASGEAMEGKPAPDLFLEAARRLGTEAGRCVVVEDAEAGVEAGRRGGFALVIGLARDRAGEPLAESGADLVVTDLAEVEVGETRG